MALLFLPLAFLSRLGNERGRERPKGETVGKAWLDWLLEKLKAVYKFIESHSLLANLVAGLVLAIFLARFPFSHSTEPATKGITLEEHDAALKSREQEIRQEIRNEVTKAGAADKEKIAFLEKELAAAQAKSKNPKAALEDYKATLEQASQALDHLQGEFSAEQLEQAHQGLTQGDASQAEMLFRQVRLLSGNKEKAALTAYSLGQLAAGRIDYQHASQYSAQAAELQPR